jgi:quinoprotein glucose dehydrogenase
MAWVIRLIERRPPAAATGKTLYEQNCAGCHGLEMRGSPPEFPSLADLSSRYSDSEMAALISAGSGRMPRSRLTADSIRAVVDYVRNGRDTPVKANSEAERWPIDQKYTIDGYNKFLDPDGYPAMQPPWGTLTAIDLSKGVIAWSVPLGQYPELAAKGMKDTGSENYGGSLATAGGLLFIGATGYDKKFRAFDKKSGRLLWETTLPAPGNATPATYAVNGRQYIVIAAGGGKGRSADSGGSYVAFALPRERSIHPGPSLTTTAKTAALIPRLELLGLPAFQLVRLSARDEISFFVILFAYLRYPWELR